MPSAKIILVITALCLVSCSADRYYFHQRIGHAENVPVPNDNKTAEVETSVSALASLTNPDSLSLLSLEESKDLSPQRSTVETKKTAGKEPVHLETINKKQTARVKPESSPPVSMATSSTSEYGLDVWLIVLLVVVGIFLISTCIALLLGYSIGHACLIGLKVLAFIILILVYLLVEALLSPRHHYH